MKLRILLLLGFLQLAPIYLSAQKKVAGVVTGDNEPLIGATVMAKGTTSGAITDFDGKFELEIPQEITYLIFSYTGFESLEVEIGSKTYFEIVLESGRINLNEVVVTALGIERDKKALGFMPCRM